MASMMISRSGELILSPPQLPAYLSTVLDLKPIVGKPADDEVKAIHTVIRSLNAVAHLPTLYDSDLSVQLSQHLFGAQLAIYRTSYSTTLLPGEKSTYTPPTLPWHITNTLKEVVGTPSNEDVKAVHNALRSVENLASHPQLFDEDLSMKLSQHMFNLQFARYMHDSAQGGFVADRETKPHSEPVPQATQVPEGDLNNIRSLTPVPEAPSELAQLGEVVKEIKGTLNESKNVLENMNRVLISTQRTQPAIGHFKTHSNSTMHLNPVNQQGVLASEHGLPQLRYYCTPGNSYSIWMHSQEIAGYLRFFGIGANLVQSGEVARLEDGREAEAKELLQKHIGLHYI